MLLNSFSSYAASGSDLISAMGGVELEEIKRIKHVSLNTTDGISETSYSDNMESLPLTEFCSITLVPMITRRN